MRNTVEGWDRAVVTPRDLISTGSSRPLSLAAHPEGSLLAYDSGNGSVWISPLNGGVPVRAVREEDSSWPMWSSDGKWMAYMSQESKTGARRLAKSRFGSNEAPQMLTGPRTFSAIPGGPAVRPSWSPTGEWIVFQVPDAVMLVDAEGRNEHVLAPLRCSAFGWSGDGKTVYAVTSAEDRQHLTAIDVKTGTVRTITTLAADSPIAARQNASLVLTLSPDGKSLLASVARTKTDIWILDGFDTRRGLFGWWKR
jgi:Tol biopolymer transport system component